MICCRVNGFFKSLKTCGTLLNRVRAALGEICRRAVGADSVIARAFTSDKAGNDAPLSDQLGTSAGRSESCDSPEPVATGKTTATETIGEDQNFVAAPPALSISGPVCRMEVSLAYIAPPKGISVLLHELERV